MKQFAAIVMLLCLSYQFTIRMGIIAWYQINKEYVATVLCENKDKPELKCCGKCYLNKQLKKTEDNSPVSKQMPKTEKVEFSLFIATVNTFASIPFNPNASLIHHERYTPPMGCDVPAAVFHPPSAAYA